AEWQTQNRIDRRFLPACFLICCLFHMACQQAFAATLVSGFVGGTWSTNLSPYILTADCTVASNQTLTVEAGVRIVIGPDVILRSYGSISAVGNPAQPILIEGASISNLWSGIT